MATNSPVTGSVDVSPVVDVAHDDALDLVVAEDVVDACVPEELDLRVGERPVLHDLGRPQLVAAVDDGDLVGELGEERGLLDGRVAAADDRDLVAAEEEAVAGRARRQAVAEQRCSASRPSISDWAPVRRRSTASAW